MLSERDGMRLADVYDRLQHRPSDPDVRRSYRAFIATLMDQFAEMTGPDGVRVYFEETDPYRCSAEMFADVDAGRLRVYTAADMPFDHPLACIAWYEYRATRDGSGRLPVTYNSVFRAVHDYIGHASTRSGFGPQGEFIAWRRHCVTMPHEALPALTAETLGQNAWVNFGPHMRETRFGRVSLVQPGTVGYLNPCDRPYAIQKACAFPFAHFVGLLGKKGGE